MCEAGQKRGRRVGRGDLHLRTFQGNGVERIETVLLYVFTRSEDMSRAPMAHVCKNPGYLGG
jgi:hypothetical protein